MKPSGRFYATIRSQNDLAMRKRHKIVSVSQPGAENLAASLRPKVDELKSQATDDWLETLMKTPVKQNGYPEGFWKMGYLG